MVLRFAGLFCSVTVNSRYAYTSYTNQKRLHQVASIDNPTIQLLHPTTSHVSLTKRSTLQHFADLQHDDTFILQFEAYNQPFILQLTPNSNIPSCGY
ncbi:unnamed protein product [Absidia cylindrospora]